VHAREVFKGAILANAASLIIAHNHPSGAPRSA
jgi:DNA repair protein RadC